MAKLIGIAIKHGPRQPMIQLQQANVTVEKGVADDFRGKKGQRQVTVLSLKSWEEACAEISQKLDWIARRANLLVDDLPLENSFGSRILIGKVILEVTGETDPCYRMDEIHFGLQEALKPAWRGGVTCRVMQGGLIKPGDDIIFKKK